MPVNNPFLQPIRSASDYAGDFQAQDMRRQALQQNALMMQESQAKMGDAADARSRANAFRSQFTPGVNPDDPAFQNKLFAADPTQAAAFAKSRQEAITSAAKARQDNANAGETEHKTRVAKANQAINNITILDTPQEALAGLQAQLQSGEIDQQKYEGVVSTLKPSLQDPSQFGMWKRHMVIGIMDAKDRIAATAPKVTMSNAGGSLVPTNENADAGPVGAMAGAAPIPITQSANNIADNLTSRQNNNATVGASYANASAGHDQAQATRDAARIQNGFQNEKGMRQEFEGLPEIKNYKTAYPAFAAIKDASKRDTMQSDINLVYGLAKLYDPTSVVREGEYATVANNQSIPEWIRGTANQLTGGARLTPKTRERILQEAQGRIKTYEAEAKKARGSYEGIAKRNGVDPENVFTRMGDMTDTNLPPEIQAIIDKHKGATK